MTFATPFKKDFTAADAYERVTRGAEWLDKHCPGWVDEINLDFLNLRSRTFCMLGQTAKCLLGQKVDGRAMHGGYTPVTYAIHWQTDSPLYEGVTWQSFEYGFDVNSWGIGGRELAERYAMLDIAWTELITKRRNEH